MICTGAHIIDPRLALVPHRPTFIASEGGCGTLCDDPQLEEFLMQLLHPTCHRQIHSQTVDAAQPRSTPSVPKA
jgi:hypothetical protein